jgi:hypothetical protein
MATVRVVLIVVGINAVVWLLILAWFRYRVAALARSINASGECLVLGPERGYYNVMKGPVSAKTMGIIALTDRRLIFNGPLGMNADIPFDQIADTSRNKWWQGNYRNGREFMILRLRDGKEVAFQVKNLDRWMQEIQPKIHG